MDKKKAALQKLEENKSALEKMKLHVGNNSLLSCLKLIELQRDP